MRLSTKGDYATRVLMELALAEGPETGWEKVALYATDDSRPTHMAR